MNRHVVIRSIVAVITMFACSHQFQEMNVGMGAYYFFSSIVWLLSVMQVWNGKEKVIEESNLH